MSVDKKVPDGLEQWRLEHAMPRLLGILEDHRTLISVTEQVKYRSPANARPPFGPHREAIRFHTGAQLRCFQDLLVRICGTLCLHYRPSGVALLSFRTLPHLSYPKCLVSGRGDVGASLSGFVGREAVAGGTPGTARMGERQ